MSDNEERDGMSATWTPISVAALKQVQNRVSGKFPLIPSKKLEGLHSDVQKP